MEEVDGSFFTEEMETQEINDIHGGKRYQKVA
jgi:hypothetical protein